jgi:hypothetical protein
MKKEIKVARGYRLYPKTHKKISKIQKLLDSDSDEAIYNACVYYIKNFLEKNKQKSL